MNPIIHLFSRVRRGRGSARTGRGQTPAPLPEEVVTGEPAEGSVVAFRPKPRTPVYGPDDDPDPTAA